MRNLFKIILSLFVILLVVLVVVVLSMDSIIKSVVNNYVPTITKTAVNVDDVNFNLLGGSFKIEGLTIGNPKGFSDKNIFSLDEVYVKLQVSSLNTSTIIINEVKIDDASLLYELKNGKTNFTALMNNINSYLGTDKAKESAPATTKSSSSKNVYIKRLAFIDGEITVNSTLTKDISLKIPDVIINNIGSPDSGISFGEAIAKTLAAFTDAAIKTVSSDAAKKLLSNAGSGVSTGLEAIKNIFK